MIRTIITPQNTDIHLMIPKDYIGKQLEVLVYTTDEITIADGTNISSAYKGKLNLSELQYQEFQSYISNSRKEW